VNIAVNVLRARYSLLFGNVTEWRQVGREPFAKKARYCGVPSTSSRCHRVPVQGSVALTSQPFRHGSNVPNLSDVLVYMASTATTRRCIDVYSTSIRLDQSWAPKTEAYGTSPMNMCHRFYDNLSKTIIDDLRYR
jgi:hypothetical protein